MFLLRHCSFLNSYHYPNNHNNYKKVVFTTLSSIPDSLFSCFVLSPICFFLSFYHTFSFFLSFLPFSFFIYFSFLISAYLFQFISISFSLFNVAAYRLRYKTDILSAFINGQNLFGMVYQVYLVCTKICKSKKHVHTHGGIYPRLLPNSASPPDSFSTVILFGTLP